MIVSRTPLRISMGGGGTDLPFYSSTHGGSLVTATINKYVYITVSSRIQRNIKLNYSQTEVVDSVANIKHPLIREALRLAGISSSIEVHSTAEIPSGTGMGSSGAFTVGLLNALYYYNSIIVPKYKLAEDSSNIIMNILNEPCGKQDQYASAFGGLNHLRIDKNGKVTVTPINVTHQNLVKLEKNLMMFYTGFTRSANEILLEQKNISENKSESKIFQYYHRIKKIGEEILNCLETGDLDAFGLLLNEHWKLKKKISMKMSNKNIDRWYGIALKNGSLGGKIMGAGGGGFLMLYVGNNHVKLKKKMEKEGLIYAPLKFDFDGTRIVYDGKHF